MKKLNHLTNFLTIVIAKIVAIILMIKKSNRDIWIIGERRFEAKDNGYHLFKYLRENYPNKKVYYAIDNKSSDFNKIQHLGNILLYDSFKHYVYYFLSIKLICAHWGACVPDSIFCWKLLEFENKRKNKRKKRIYIKHGIIKEMLPTAMYAHTRCDLFICGAKPEYDFVKNAFGYPEGVVQYTGLSRFDNLHANQIKNQILVMPTWRKWMPGLTWKSGNIDECRKDFLKTEYYNRYNSLINNHELIALLERHNLDLVFYPHYEMQVYIDLFYSNSDRVYIARKDEYDVQMLLKESKILITDYSSVAFDFGYMKKTVIYYQFDEEIYYEKHYQRGYYDYKEHGFGPVVNNQEDLIAELASILDHDGDDTLYKKRYEEFYPLHDQNNCKRIIDAINNL